MSQPLALPVLQLALLCNWAEPTPQWQF